MKLLARIFIAFSSLCVIPLHASNINVVDPSFEGIDLQVESSAQLGGTVFGSLGAWGTTVDNGPGSSSFVSAGDDLAATDGTALAFFSFGIGVGNGATMVNTVSYTLIPNQYYRLNFQIGQPDSTAGVVDNLLIQILANDNSVLATSEDGALYSLLLEGEGLQDSFIEFNSGANPVAGNISISISAGGLAGAESGLLLDNFRLTAVPVPEPASFALIGGALAACLVITRRKR
jgi:hypothetical protein